ncbi:hypothetical protein ACVWXQ_001274 [Bradyrhizobium sp. S3.14.4]
MDVAARTIARGGGLAGLFATACAVELISEWTPLARRSLSFPPRSIAPKLSKPLRPQPLSKGYENDGTRLRPLVGRPNLEHVFNERDSGKRKAAIADLYVEEPVMYEPTAIVRGRNEIARIAGELLERFGPTFTFVPDGIAVGHHDIGCLHWHAGPKDGPVAVTGMDVAEIVEGRISRLWVMLNPSS